MWFKIKKGFLCVSVPLWLKTVVFSKRPASHILKVPAVILFPVSKDAAADCRFQWREWC